PSADHVGPRLPGDPLVVVAKQAVVAQPVFAGFGGQAAEAAPAIDASLLVRRRLACGLAPLQFLLEFLCSELRHGQPSPANYTRTRIFSQRTRDASKAAGFRAVRYRDETIPSSASILTLRQPHFIAMARI